MKIRRKVQDKSKWRKKFAWLPTQVDKTEKEYGVVWFESYFQKAGFVNGTWIRHSKGEYMRKTLKGDLEPKTVITDSDTFWIDNSAPRTITLGDLNIAGSTTTVFKDSDAQWTIHGDGFTLGEEDFQIELDFAYDSSIEKGKSK